MRLLATYADSEQRRAQGKERPGRSERCDPPGFVLTRRPDRIPLVAAASLASACPPADTEPSAVAYVAWVSQRPVQYRYRSPDEDSARWLDFAYRPGDIVISTRSKHGTTWMQMICVQIRAARWRAGDGGFVDHEGYLHISDRKKDVIITGGENVSSIEVEDRLFSHPAVAEAAVIGVPSDRWGETVKAFVVLADGAHADQAELIAHCKAGLAGFKAPSSVEFVESIPRTATGKVQKFKLREPYWREHDRQVN